MNTSEIIKSVLETLREERKNELKDKVTVVTKIFNNFKEEKDDNYDSFREFINDRECLCHIKGYAGYINSLSDDEIKQVINNTGLTENEFFAFTHILINRVNEVRSDILGSISKFKTRFEKQFDVEVKDDVDFESMSKEKLIDYIKKNK